MMTTQQIHTAQIRQGLYMAFDDSSLSAFCFDYFPAVYDRFSVGMRKDHKIALLLEYCHNHPTGFERLLDVVREEYTYPAKSGKMSHFQREELLPLIDAFSAYTGASRVRESTFPETARLFFESAGFELVSHQETAFLCKPKDRVWQRKFSQPIFVEFVLGKRLNAETIRTLRYSALQTIGEKPTIFVVIDRTPTDDGWLQIATMRAEDIQVIPVDDTLIWKGQEQRRQHQVLAKHLRRFLANEQDFYDVRDPVADRLNFFGREALASELRETLIKGRPLALFGLRKIGKSSLLKFLSDKLPFPTALVDLQAGVALAGLYERILTSWSRSIRVKVKGLEWSPPDLTGSPDPTSAFTLAVHQLLKQLEDSGAPQRLCLLVDEADLLMPDDKQGVGDYLAFTRSLRGLVQEEESFSLLIAGVDPSLNRINRWQRRQNPFYQFFREIYLPPLDYDDCIQMTRNIAVLNDL